MIVHGYQSGPKRQADPGAPHPSFVFILVHPKRKVCVYALNSVDHKKYKMK